MSDVSRETNDISLYADLIRKWNRAINLVSPITLDQLEDRHILDSRQLAEVSLSSTGTWVDLGSGGGLPGLVIAILRRDLGITLVESDARKCTFLRTVIRDLGLQNVTMLNQRIERVHPMNSQNISARALAPLPLLMSYVDRHLSGSGTAWLMKGRNWRAEVEEARKTWRFDMHVHPSITDPEAAILELSGIRHA